MRISYNYGANQTSEAVVVRTHDVRVCLLFCRLIIFVLADVNSISNLSLYILRHSLLVKNQRLNFKIIIF